MITRSLIVVWGLVLIDVAGPLVARGQEPTARGEGRAQRPPRAVYKDWQAAGHDGRGGGGRPRRGARRASRS